MDSSDFFMAPLLKDETTERIMAECRGEAGETKLYEEKEGRFVTYSGIKVPQKMKQKTAEVWLRANMRMGIKPYALYVKKTGWGFFASCVSDGMFAEEELEGRKISSSCGISALGIPGYPSMSSVQRSMLGWRKKKKLVADSVNAAIFAEEDYIRVKTAYVDEFIIDMLKNFEYDRKTGTWTGKDIDSALKLIRLDGLPDTKTYGRGLYYLCETERIKKPADYSSCFAALFSL